ncbi:Uncharacterised protein [Mycobacteroides abscessus subsp. abscessus]|nr:Uncharacterised protein [Mycobacteroides abscessus subsp. abscessus]
MPFCWATASEAMISPLEVTCACSMMALSSFSASLYLFLRGSAAFSFTALKNPSGSS